MALIVKGNESRALVRDFEDADRDGGHAAAAAFPLVRLAAVYSLATPAAKPIDDAGDGDDCLFVSRDRLSKDRFNPAAVI